LRHYLQWAETHFGRTIDNHTWQYRVGESRLASGHYKEAILAFKEIEPHMQDSWSLAFSLATVYGQLNDYRTSLRYIQKLKALSDQYWKSDKGFREAHWKLLLAESNCYRQLQDYESAVKGFTSILSQDLDEGPNSD
jgi:tetratricopeptide (TPR) repeat protein